MLKNFIKKYLPNRDVIRKQRALSIFGNLLYDPNIWCLNRRSASGAFAVGLFMAFIPLPTQMVMAAGLAIFFRVNLPLSVALVWITNPITMPIIFYGTYKLGVLLLGAPIHQFNFELTWDFLFNQMDQIGPPFLLGCMICAVFFSAVGYASVRAIWRYSVIRNWQKRRFRLATFKDVAQKMTKKK